MPARELTGRLCPAGLLFYCFTFVLMFPVSGQTIVWRGDGNANFYSVNSNWEGLGGAPTRIPTINDDVLFDSLPAIYPNPAAGIQIFANLAVRNLDVDLRDVVLRPEGRYSVINETQIDLGSLRILPFSSQTAYITDSLSTRQSGFSIAAGVFGSSNATVFQDSAVDIGGTFISGSTSLRGGVLNIASGGRFDQFTGSLGVADSAQVNIAAGGTLNIRSTSRLGISADSVVNVAGQLTVDGLLSNAGFTVVDGGQLTVGSIGVGRLNGPVRFRQGSIHVTGTSGSSLRGIDGGTMLMRFDDRLTVDHRLTIETGQLINMSTSDNLRAGSISLLGGTLAALNGPIDVSAISADNQISGSGEILAAITGDRDAVISAVGGDLVLDSRARPGGNHFDGQINTGKQSVVVRNTEPFTLGERTAIGAGGRLISSGGLELLANRTLTASGIATIDGPFVNQGTVNGSFGSETLTFLGDVSGSGSYTGNIVFSDAFDPGNSAGEVSFENVMFDDSSTLSIELGGLIAGVEHDLLSISGDATLGGSLAVSLIDGFMLGEGQRFNFFNVDGVIGGQFIGLGEGDLVGNFGGTDLFITYAGGNGNDVSLFTAAAVPEPSSLALLTVIGLGIAHRRRRTKTNVCTG